MFINDDVEQIYLDTRADLIRASALHDFDIKYFQNGGVMGTGAYYKLAQHKDGRVRLMASSDPFHLTGCKVDGKEGLYVAFPENIRIIREYENLPSLHQEIRWDILGDRPRWHDFMVRYGNLVELPFKDDPNIYFENEFATYVASPVLQDSSSAEQTYEIFVHLDTGDKITSRPKHVLSKLVDKCQHIKTKGVRVGHYIGTPDDVKSFIHSDFCVRFDRFMNGKNPLTPEDLRADFAHCASMMLSNKWASINLRDIPFDGYLDAIHWLFTVGTIDVAFSLTSATFNFLKRLKHVQGKYAEAVLPPTHPSYQRMPFSAAEAYDWRIMPAEEVRVHPQGATVHNTVDDGWVLPALLSAIHSSTPCLVKGIGNHVISVQEPNGTKLYYCPNGDVFVVYASDYAVTKNPGVDPNNFIISEKLTPFFKEGKVACLRMKGGLESSPTALTPSSTAIKDEIDVELIPCEAAYAMLGKASRCDPLDMIAIDHPGIVPPFAKLTPILEVTCPPPQTVTKPERHSFVQKFLKLISADFA